MKKPVRATSLVQRHECQDIKPTFLPKMEPKLYHDEGGGGQEGQNAFLVVIKTEQSHPEENSSFVHGGENQHDLQQSKNVSSPSCEPPSTSKEAWMNQHTLKEDTCNSLVIIKMEPDEGELSSSGRRCVLHEPEGVSNLLALWKTEPGSAYSDEEPLHDCGSEDLNTSGISGDNVPTLIPKTEPPATSVEHPEDDGGAEFECKNQHIVEEDVHSSLDIIIKLEPDEQELISSGEHHVFHELEEVSDLPTVCKTEPTTLGMPYSAYTDEEPWHENSGKEENGGFNISAECNQPSDFKFRGEPSMDCDSPDFVPSIFSHSNSKGGKKTPPRQLSWRPITGQFRRRALSDARLGQSEAELRAAAPRSAGGGLLLKPRWSSRTAGLGLDSERLSSALRSAERWEAPFIETRALRRSFSLSTDVSRHHLIVIGCVGPDLEPLCRSSWFFHHKSASFALRVFLSVQDDGEEEEDGASSVWSSEQRGGGVYCLYGGACKSEGGSESLD
ncbi:hypothetical protein MHYP_G00104200 [Metynnis hypsauchen]